MDLRMRALRNCDASLSSDAAAEKSSFYSPKVRRVMDDFLEVSARQANRSAAPGSRVKAFEIQRWEWDFRAEPESPTHGHLVENYYYWVER